jgi:hypothetical protein
MKVDEMLYVETDCGFACDWWDRPLWAEFELWPQAVVGGTPVILGQPLSIREALDQEEYCHQYTKRANMPVLVLTEHPREMHVNGALAIYKVAALQQMCTDLLRNFEERCLKTPPYDLWIGQLLCAKQGRVDFSAIAPLTSSYSECNTRYTTAQDVRKMLGEKVAVHKYSY